MGCTVIVDCPKGRANSSSTTETIDENDLGEDEDAVGDSDENAEDGWRGWGSVIDSFTQEDEVVLLSGDGCDARGGTAAVFTSPTVKNLMGLIRWGTRKGKRQESLHTLESRGRLPQGMRNIFLTTETALFYQLCQNVLAVLKGSSLNRAVSAAIELFRLAIGRGTPLAATYTELTKRHSGSKGRRPESIAPRAQEPLNAPGASPRQSMSDSLAQPPTSSWPPSIPEDNDYCQLTCSCRQTQSFWSHRQFAAGVAWRTQIGNGWNSISIRWELRLDWSPGNDGEDKARTLSCRMRQRDWLSRGMRTSKRTRDGRVSKDLLGYGYGYCSNPYPVSADRKVLSIPIHKQ
ncbi:uncharacterized protein EV422DRAFT_503285 [Fimicolochytrium jonesii]|uniref:uncharacterized protein n=1 Tax=Fimicolochytrium jonesii TaxID=1396493 RepID=UPI0022FF108A|nr:uncharacterized protein EV422DRAFT_503285 [Fimicolochytrium jonesii]KAI8825936.1 hypothetical protein EV422DRAFT_503285 [Fimicolochytrium jonesii]